VYQDRLKAKEGWGSSWFLTKKTTTRGRFDKNIKIALILLGIWRDYWLTSDLGKNPFRETPGKAVQEKTNGAERAEDPSCLIHMGPSRQVFVKRRMKGGWLEKRRMMGWGAYLSQTRDIETRKRCIKICARRPGKKEL